jgi:hypothetical protein
MHEISLLAHYSPLVKPTHQESCLACVLAFKTLKGFAGERRSQIIGTLLRNQSRFKPSFPPWHFGDEGTPPQEKPIQTAVSAVSTLRTCGCSLVGIGGRDGQCGIEKAPASHFEEKPRRPRTPQGCRLEWRMDLLTAKSKS